MRDDDAYEPASLLAPESSQPPPPNPMVQQAVETLLLAGMVVRYRSRFGHSWYLGWPGRSGVLRVSDHPTKATMTREDEQHILAKVTLHLASQPRSDEAMRDRLGTALGRFLIASAPPTKIEAPGPTTEPSACPHAAGDG